MFSIEMLSDMKDQSITLFTIGGSFSGRIVDIYGKDNTALVRFQQYGHTKHTLIAISTITACRFE
jgi:hypothetical protein